MSTVPGSLLPPDWDRVFKGTITPDTAILVSEDGFKFTVDSYILTYSYSLKTPFGIDKDTVKELHDRFYELKAAAAPEGTVPVRGNLGELQVPLPGYILEFAIEKWYYNAWYWYWVPKDADDDFPAFPHTDAEGRFDEKIKTAICPFIDFFQEIPKGDHASIVMPLEEQL